MSFSFSLYSLLSLALARAAYVALARPGYVRRQSAPVNVVFLFILSQRSNRRADILRTGNMALVQSFVDVALFVAYRTSRLRRRVLCGFFFVVHVRPAKGKKLVQGVSDDARSVWQVGCLLTT